MHTKLRTLRKDRGLRQVDLAEMLDVSQATMTNYETAYRRPQKASTRKHLEALFGLSIDQLWEIENDNGATQKDDAAKQNSAKN